MYVLWVVDLRCCRRSDGRRSLRACCSLQPICVSGRFVFGVVGWKRTLELRLSQRWCVASNDDELGLAGAQCLQRRLVAECDLAGLCAVSGAGDR